MFWKWLRKKPVEKPKRLEDLIPEGWIVVSLGQSYLHCLWYCEMINLEKYLNTKETQVVFTEEHETATQAVKHALHLISIKSFSSYDEMQR